MKKLLFPVVALIFALSLIQSCSKGGGGGCTEPAMTVTSDPAAGSNLPPAVGPTFPLQVNITANKPSAGVTIEVKAHPEGNNTNFYTTSVSSTSNTTNFTIANTPAGVTSVVDITVTSKSCATNKVTLTYKYAMK